MRKINSIYLSVLLSVAMMFISCTEHSDSVEDTPTGNSQTPGIDIPTTVQKGKSVATYQFGKEVSQLSTNAQKNYLVKVEQDSILFFLPETPDSIMPKVGKILSSPITDKLPYGLGNKVISKTEEDGLIKFVTTVASLEELFEDLHIDAEFSIEDILQNHQNVIYDDDGNAYDVSIKDINEVFPETSHASTRAEFGSDKVLEIPIGKDDKENGFQMDMKLIIGAVFTYEVDKNSQTYEYSIKPTVGVIGTFGAKYESDSQPIWDVTEKVTNLLNIFSKKNLVNTTFTIGAITLRPFMDLNVTIVWKVAGEFTSGFMYKIGSKVGYSSQKGFFCENVSDELDLEKIFNYIKLNGNVQIGPEAKIVSGIGLYTRNLAVKLNIKPAFLIGAELGLDVDSNNKNGIIGEQNLTLDLTADVSGAISGDLVFLKWEKETPEMHLNLYNKTWPIFPELDRSRFEFKTRIDNPLRVDVSYCCKDGVLMKIFGGIPGLMIKKDNVEVFRTENNLGETGSNFVPETAQYVFPCSGLEPGEKYTACPTVRFWRTGMVYEWPGEEFTAGDSFIRAQICPDDHHPHLIDLGLPSGTKWSCCNVGASEPAAMGKLFAYGEIEEKASYTAQNYKFTTTLENFYDNFGAGSLGSIAGNVKYDAARAIMGAPWHMPTGAQLKELIDNCIVENKVIHGYQDPILGGDGIMKDVNVWLFTSKKNGKMILIPHSMPVESKTDLAGIGMSFNYLAADGEPWEYINQGKSGFRTPYRIYWNNDKLEVYASTPDMYLVRGLQIRPVQ